MVKWHRWIDVVLNVVVHVPINPSIERPHIDGARVQSMVSGVLGKTRMLSYAQYNYKPVTVDAW